MDLKLIVCSSLSNPCHLFQTGISTEYLTVMAWEGFNKNLSEKVCHYFQKMGSARHSSMSIMVVKPLNNIPHSNKGAPLWWWCTRMYGTMYSGWSLMKKENRQGEQDHEGNYIFPVLTSTKQTNDLTHNIDSKWFCWFENDRIDSTAFNGWNWRKKTGSKH